MADKAFVYDAESALFRPLSGGSPVQYVPPPPPNAPAAVTNSAITPDGWTTSWSAPSGGSVVLGYRVFVNGTQVGTDLSATTLSLAIAGQAPGTYTVTVKAFNASGVSAAGTSSVTVTGGASGSPNPPTGVTNSAVTSTGWTTSWTAPAAGAAPTGYRVFINSVKYGGDLPATARSVNVTGQAAGSYSVTVKAFNPTGASTPGGPATVSLGITSPPGLQVGKVLVGWYAAKASANNDPDHAAVLMDSRNVNEGASAWWQSSGNFAKTIPAGLFRTQTNVFKEFQSNTFISNASLLANLADADAAGYYLCQTTKVLNADWKSVANGSRDSTLSGYAQIVLDRIAAGKQPFALSLHHEPHGSAGGDPYDGVTRTPALWAAMVTYFSYFMAGWRGGNPGTAGAVYHPELDTRAGCSVICIPNGFLFTGSAADKTELRQLMPDTLIQALNTNHGIISPDIYDNTTVGKRVYDKINAVANWCRTYGALHAGITETGCYDAVTIQKLWEAVKANADIFRYVIYWDSGIGEVPGGATDWRLLPNGYPSDASAGADPTKPFVGPGTAVTQGLLKYWRDVALVESEAM